MEKSSLVTKMCVILKKEIKSGVYGKPGDSFITTRQLSKLKGIALVTASKTMIKLKEEGLIELIRKKYYLTHGLIEKGSDFPNLRRRKKIIGIHVPILDVYTAFIVKYIERYAREGGYQIISASSDYNIDNEKAILNMFRAVEVSGVISAPWSQGAKKSVYEHFCLPLVFLGHKPEGVLNKCVYIDQYSAGRHVAEHFIAQGYQNFAYVGVETWGGENDDRLSGFQAELLRTGYLFGGKNIIMAKIDESYDIYPRLKALLLKQKEPLAIFCFHEMLALNAIHTCQISNIDIPNQVAVAAFENNFPVALYANPKITTIGYNIKGLAGGAVSLLINEIEGGGESNKEFMIEPILTVRESTRNNNKERE